MKRTAISFAIALVLAPLRSAAVGPTDSCNVGDQPAATLLFPYFQADLSVAEGKDTSIAVHNQSSAPTLAHFVLWTDWGLPTASFDAFLLGKTTVTFSLRELFRSARAPVTGPGNRFPGCAAFLGGSLGSATELEAKHTGQPVGGLCWGAPRSRNRLVRGYVTVDAALRCDASRRFPSQASYFEGEQPVTSTANVLTGDWTLLWPGTNSATAGNAVPIVADRERFGSGDFTFYGRFVGYRAVDQRAPLASEWLTHYPTARGSGTQFIVWRDTRSRFTAPAACNRTPAGLPLPHAGIRAFEGAPLFRDAALPGTLPLATQLIAAGDLAGPSGLPYEFASLLMNLDSSSRRSNQAWVAWLAQPAGAGFATSSEGVRLNDLCERRP